MNGAKLAGKAGVSPDDISAIEDGNVRPGRDTINLIAKALGVSRLWLLTGISPESVEEQIGRDELEVGISTSTPIGKARPVNKDRAMKQVPKVPPADKPQG
jgi:transcriptional regulator with XRE-family HTH domain